MENQVIDTGNLQLFELEKFANNLGFELHGGSFHRYNAGKNKVLKANMVVSFADMVAFFNNENLDKVVNVGSLAVFQTRGPKENEDGSISTPVGFAVRDADLEAAYKAQAIVKVKLQYSRKKGVIVLNNMVAFYDDDMAAEFAQMAETEMKLEDTYAS